MSEAENYPRGIPVPAEDDLVQVLMPQRLARVFERRCLPFPAKLAGPVIFSEDDLATYLITTRDP